jgi:hypothetical protein
VRFGRHKYLRGWWLHVGPLSVRLLGRREGSPDVSSVLIRWEHR